MHKTFFKNSVGINDNHENALNGTKATKSLDKNFKERKQIK